MTNEEFKQMVKELVKAAKADDRRKQTWWPSSVVGTLRYPGGRKSWKKSMRELDKKAAAEVHNQLMDAAYLSSMPMSRVKNDK